MKGKVIKIKQVRTLPLGTTDCGAAVEPSLSSAQRKNFTDASEHFIPVNW